MPTNPATPKPKKAKGRKIGPLPVWGWAAVGAGVYGVYTIYRRHNANLAAAGATTIPLGVGTATEPGTGTPGATTTTSTSITGPTIAGLRAKFLAQATAKAGGGLTQAEALDAWNKFISGQALTGRAAQATKNIIGNLSAGGFIPAGVSAVVNIAAPSAGTTTAHTPTAVTPAYVPTGGGSSSAASTNKPAATRSTGPTRMVNAIPAARPTVRGGQPLQPVTPIGGIGPNVPVTPAGAGIIRAINTIPGVFQIPISTRGTGPVNVQAPKKNKKKGAQGAYGLASPVNNTPAPAGGGFDLNPFHWLGF